MTRRPPPRPFHRGLDRASVLDAALELLDRDGRDGLTMRAVAAARDVQAPALYTHVRNKQDLVDGVIDRVLAGVEVPTVDPVPDWRAALIAGFSSYRRVLVEHPGVFGLVIERTTQLPVQMLLVERSILLLEQSGLTTERAAAAQVTLAAYELGFVAQEVRRPTPTPTPTPPPVFQRAITALGATTVDERFRAGLDIILDGVVGQ
jgi:AcrR family transcriptional regulator